MELRCIDYNQVCGTLSIPESSDVVTANEGVNYSIKFFFDNIINTKLYLYLVHGVYSDIF